MQAQRDAASLAGREAAAVNAARAAEEAARAAEVPHVLTRKYDTRMASG